jgi:hypothetical protein
MDRKNNTAPSTVQQKAIAEKRYAEPVTFRTSNGEVKMLKFKSWGDFDVLSKYLQSEMDKIDEDFNRRHADLSDDELNDLEDATGFTNETPLISFENQLGFKNSYRNPYNKKVKEWLNHETLALDNAPQMQTMFSGAELSLINDRQQVMVNDTIYQCGASDEGYYAISGDYSANLSKLQSNKEVPESKTLVRVKIWTKNPECTIWKSVPKPGFVEGTDKGVLMFCAIRSFTLYCKSSAQVLGLKKNGNVYKQYKTQLNAGVQGLLRDYSCGDVVLSSSDWNNKKTKALVVAFTSWGGAGGGSSYRAKKGLSIFGNFTAFNNSFAHVLTW